MKMIKYSILLFAIISMTACAPYKNIPKLKSFQDLNYRVPVKTIQLDNEIEVAYTDEGSGTETIIFIHGLGSYIPAYDKLIPELSKKYRCIAIDLPGYGKSSKAPHSGMMSFYADIIHEITGKLGIDKFSLAGHSMGGQISVVYGLSWPEQLNNLILFAPAGFERFTPGQKEWFEDIMTPILVHNTTYEGIETNLAFNFYNMPKDAEFMMTDRMAMREASDFGGYCYAVSKSVAGMINEPIIDKLDQLEIPTLIFFGENDNLIPNRYLNPGTTSKIAEYGHEHISDSKLIMIPKCGHFLMFEKPEIVIEEMKLFIN
ncbi:alpha/beta fold hydrolase [Lentimicrobium sp. S6]|uniref:alpha/beta fold hydrolase n=1 Tax=Lentimicrobium sp. S6 TaxID=2735872 RepID=UPI001553EFAD|nr:alpha/beta hydrolase [Lentimicrobium sp. S6]NPD44570.1 alpha/beta hydrolase [Lentimicrobium sp. S6]